MNSRVLKLSLLTGALILGFTAISLAVAENSPKPQPQVIYQQAWRLVRENFYRQDFNKQDWTRWKDRYNGKLNTLSDAHKAIETMLSSLGDPYTRLMTDPDGDDFKNETEIVGVGMQLGTNKEHQTIVLGIMDDTPASKAAIKSGWEVTAIEGKPVKNLSLDEIVKRIRGPANTSVKITFATGTSVLTQTLVRQSIPIRSVALVKRLPNNLAYIELQNMLPNSGQEMKEALLSLADTSGLILDLRNNRGDESITAPVDIANMFLGRGIIVSTIDADGYKNSTYAMNRPIYKKPVVVLINKGTSRTAEFLAAALNETGGIPLVGERTFGNGLVSATNRLDDGSSMKISIAVALTPKDQSINQGLTPNKEVKVDFESGNGPWWFDPSFSGKKRSGPDEKDLQFSAALSVLRNILPELKI
jgi:Periplasmic protease